MRRQGTQHYEIVHLRGGQHDRFPTQPRSQGMKGPAANRLYLQAWLAARSVARGLPRPVAEFGGYRVDTCAEDEIARWVFPTISDGFHDLVQSIRQPGYLVKLCDGPEQMRKVLPPNWELHEPGYFMKTVSTPSELRLASGYTTRSFRSGSVIKAIILAASGEVAASGYAADTRAAFVYDRIVTEEGHRRRGLASHLINVLHSARSDPEAPQLLVATPQGRSLYSALGWELLSPYSTASFGAA